MSNQEMFIKILKIVHNEYIEIICEIEDSLQRGYEQKAIPTFGDRAAEESIMHSTVQLICRELKQHCDERIKQIKEEKKE